MAGKCVDKLSHSCGSNDGLQVFEVDGKYTGFCFRCGKYIDDPYEEGAIPVGKGIKKTEEEIRQEIKDISKYPAYDLPTRKLNKETLERFRVTVGVDETDGLTPRYVFFPYFNRVKELIRYKVRILDPKNMWFMGSGQAMPFGWFESILTGAKKLFIVEGEFDVLALYQVLKEATYGTKYEHYDPAIISFPTGASGILKEFGRIQNDIRRHFEEIIFIPDQDDAGRQAVDALVKTYPFIKIADIPAKDVNAGLIEGKAKAIHRSVVFKSVVPKNTRIMRGHFFTEKAKEKPEWGISWPWEGMTKATRGIRRGETLYFGAGVKMGKEMPYSLVIPTPKGDRTWESLKVGDEVFGRNGKATRITHIWEQGEKDVYEIKFSDGTSTLCGLNHLWPVKHYRKGEIGPLSTKEIMKKLKDYRGYRIWSIPSNEAVVYPHQELLIDPYLLGIWLGDGNNSDGRITIPDVEIWEKLGEIGKELENGSRKTHTVLGLEGKLRQYNLLNNKHIPEIYLKASIPQRLKLLQGLLDSDGTVEKHGSVIFSSSIEAIRDGVSYLAQSLGLITRCSIKEITFYKRVYCKPSYKCCITWDGETEILTLKRKKERLKQPVYPGHRRKVIDDVMFSHREQCKCITVEAEDSLYLVNDFIVTHNSELVSSLAAELIRQCKIPVFLIKPEEAPVKSYQRLVGKAAHRIFHDPLVEFDHEAYDKFEPLVRDYCIILDSYQFLNWDSLKDDIRYVVKNEQVQDIFLDPITCLTNQMSSAEANEFLVAMTAELSAMSKDLNFTPYLFCHLKSAESGPPHERGGKVLSHQFAGSRAMMRTCNYMIGLEGNKDPDLSLEERNRRDLVILEDREFGSSERIKLYWDYKTGVFTEVK